MTAQTARGSSATAAAGVGERDRRPLYARLLRLRHLQLTAWQRVLLSDGVLLVAVLLVLADLATAWSLPALPLTVAAVVKLHDLAAGLLAPGTPTAPVPQDRRRRTDVED